jgi:hypothetical protein
MSDLLPSPDPMLGLLYAAAYHLMPLFKIGTIDDDLARQMAVSAIEAYQPETRADYLNVARTIACSMTALALLGKTASPDMPLPEQMRAYGRANALNRSADQSERTMMQRRRYQKANPPVEQPELLPAANAPEMAIAEAEIGAAVADLMREYLSASAATPVETVTQVMPRPLVSPPRRPGLDPFRIPETGQPDPMPHRQEAGAMRGGTIYSPTPPPN